MKLNPPETAPRDGTAFLANFGTNRLAITAMSGWEPHLWLATESGPEPKRMIEDYGRFPHMAVPIGMCNKAWLMSRHYQEDEMVGWLPMPQIDKEGNVTWPPA